MTRRLLLVLALTFSAVAAFAATDPMAVRITVYLRMPSMGEEGVTPEMAPPDTLLAAPAAGWPASYDDIRRILSARKKGPMEVLIADLQDPKVLQAEPSAAFFIKEVARALEVRPAGPGTADVLLPSGKHVTVPATPGSVSVFGAPDEQVYLAVAFKPWSQELDDTLVIFSGTKPLRTVSRVDPKFPALEGWRNRTGAVVTQLRIDPDGSVSSVEVLQKVHPKIDAATAEALKQWKFEPPTRNGHPVTAYMMMTVPVHFD